MAHRKWGPPAHRSPSWKPSLPPRGGPPPPSSSRAWVPQLQEEKREGGPPLSPFHQPVGRGQSQSLPPLLSSTPPTHSPPQGGYKNASWLDQVPPLRASQAGWTSRPVTDGGHSSLRLAVSPGRDCKGSSSPTRRDTRGAPGSLPRRRAPAPEPASEGIKCAGLRCRLLLAPV